MWWKKKAKALRMLPSILYKNNGNLLSSKNWDVKYLLCVIEFFTNYSWLKPSKDEKRETVLNDFIIIVSESNRQPNKLWVDQGREFYNSPFTTLVGTKLLKIFQWMKKLNS